MRLLKTHSHTSERPGYEARKNAKKVIEGNADTIRRQTTRQKPAAYHQCVGGGETKKALWQDRSPKKALWQDKPPKKAPWQDKPPLKPSRVPSAWRGVETKKGKLKENTGAKTRETNIKTLPQATIVAVERDTKGKTKHEMERWHNQQSREGGGSA